jgi:hypothetical protein
VSSGQGDEQLTVAATAGTASAGSEVGHHRRGGGGGGGGDGRMRGSGLNSGPWADLMQKFREKQQAKGLRRDQR